MNKILAACLLCVLAASATADELYQVELILFENLDPTAQFSEAWPENPGLPALEDSIELSEQSAPAPEGVITTPLDAAVAAPAAEKNPWRQLTATELKMGDVYQRLRGSARYRPLLHMGWVQALDNSDRNLAVHVHGGPQGGPAPSALAATVSAGTVDGTVALRRGRFLHTDVDLLYTKAAAPPAVDAFASPPLQARMIDSRRLRNKEVHYLDHPLFGVIITVSPVENTESSGTQ